jgi:hypothetical protein
VKVKTWSAVSSRLRSAHHDERGFAPMLIYHLASGTQVIAIVRPARTAKVTGVR